MRDRTLRRPSSWFRSVLGAGGAWLCLAALATTPASAAAQDDDLERECGAFAPASASECRLAAGAARVLQPRLATALLGGNPVPGTASTLGMRLGSLPRMSLAFRVTGARAAIPPALDRDIEGSRGATLFGFTADGSVGILTGFSPLPTVGGVLSLDLVGRLGYLPLSDGDGFTDGGALGWMLGARVGLLRESFTLPGVSVTGSYGRLSTVTFGDPDGASDTYFDGAISDFRVGLAATKRIGLVGLTAGLAYDRYSSDLDAAFRPAPAAPRMDVSGEVEHGRRSAYLNAAWTLLIFQATAELGWQESPEPAGLPPDVDLDTPGWHAGLAFRVSI